jgi:hypothetical protein
MVQVNGKFFGWMRGTKEGLAFIDEEATEAVGEKVESLQQMKRENVTKYETAAAAAKEKEKK